MPQNLKKSIFKNNKIKQLFNCDAYQLSQLS